MSARMRQQGERQVYRPVFSRALIAVLAAVGLWWDVDLLLRSRPGQFVLATLWLVAGCALLGALFWRPAVVVDPDGAELRNVLRDVRVPWAALEAVETRYALTLVAAGRRHTSWAGSAGGRPPRRRPSDAGAGPGVDLDAGPASRHLRTPSGVTAFMVEERWRAWQQAARARAFLASHQAAPPSAPATSAAREAVEPAPEAAEPAPEAAEPAPAVVVRWRPHLAAVAVGAAALAALLTPVLG